MACGRHFWGEANCLACNAADEAAKTRRTIEDEAHRNRKHSEKQAYQASNIRSSTSFGDSASGLVLVVGIFLAIILAAIGMVVAMIVVPIVLIAEIVLLAVGQWRPENLPAGWLRRNRNRVVLDRMAVWSIPTAIGLLSFTWYGQSPVGVLGGVAAGFIFILATWRMLRFMKRMPAVTA